MVIVNLIRKVVDKLEVDQSQVNKIVTKIIVGSIEMIKQVFELIISKG